MASPQFPPIKLYDKLITVKVGFNKEPFEVLCALICHYSTYFKAALNGENKEYHERLVVLEEDNPDIFRILFTWLNTRSLTDTAVMDHSLAWSTLLSKVWVFGDARGIPDFQNAVMEQYMALYFAMGIPAPRFEIRWILEHTLTTAPIRRFAIDLLVSRPRDSVIADLKSWQKVEPHQLAKEFFSEVAFALAARLLQSPHGETGERRRLDNTKYHVPLIAEAKE